MPTAMLTGQDIDDRLKWPAGKADRLAKQRRLPHYRLPDGAIRFSWQQIEPLITEVATTADQSEVSNGS